MIERVIENWLTRANELALQVPFCQLLASEGFQVVHLTRHGPFEQGKDIIAIGPHGKPCAFQLKNTAGGKFTNKAWETEVAQVTRLVEVPIVHPSITAGESGQRFLVINGELDEEVRLEIDNRNIGWAARGYPKLETITKGQLLTRFRSLQTDLWPTGLRFEKELLDLFLADGKACLPKGKLAGLILAVLPFSADAGSLDSKSKLAASRALAGAALFTSYGLSPYSEQGNHVALIEGWTVYLACLGALAEKYGLEEKFWRESLAIATFAIEQSFLNLREELALRSHLTEGNPLFDFICYRERVTWLAGLVSVFSLWKYLRSKVWTEDHWLQAFLDRTTNLLALWGEGAVPLVVARAWALRLMKDHAGSDAVLARMSAVIIATHTATQARGIPDPYHGLPEILAQRLDPPTRPDEESYYGQSYTLEGLVHLLVKRGHRNILEQLWPRLTRVSFAGFVPSTAWEYCLWSAENGINVIVQPSHTQSWSDLQVQAAHVDLSVIPQLFQQRPELLLLFTAVYPHRFTADAMKFLDTKLSEV